MKARYYKSVAKYIGYSYVKLRVMSCSVNLHQELHKDGGETKYPGKHASCTSYHLSNRICGIILQFNFTHNAL